MAEVIRMPRMSDTMEEGNIIAWLKEEGDSVEPGETLAEVETDKATMELDAFVEGVLLHIAVKEGAVPIDGVIAVIGQQGEDWKAAMQAADGNDGTESADQEAPQNGQPSSATPDQPATEAAPATTPATATTSTTDQRLKVSPLARSMAREAGVDLAALAGSGDNGRIVRRDVESYLEQQSTPATAPTATPAPAAPATTPAPAAAPAPNVPAFHYGGSENNYEDKPVSQMRKTISRRLGESKFSAPHFYLTMEMDMGKVSDLRQRINEVSEVKISFNDLVVKAVAASLRHHPAVNSSWQGDTIRYNRNINIGVAVAVEDGLLVPVVRHADMKTLSQINLEVKDMAGRAKNRKLALDEMQGNTFTISNLGMFGIEEFTAIINPPDACILAVGGIIEKPVVRDGAITVGKMMKVTLSCDHRVVDGATAAKFLQTLQQMIEDPIRLMV